MPIPDWLRDELAATPDPEPAPRPVRLSPCGHPTRDFRRAVLNVDAWGCRVCWLLDRRRTNEMPASTYDRMMAASANANRIEANAWEHGRMPPSIQRADRDEQRDRDAAKIDIPDGTDAEVVAYARRYIEGRGAAGPVDGAREWHRTIDRICDPPIMNAARVDITHVMGRAGAKFHQSTSGPPRVDIVDIEWPKRAAPNDATRATFLGVPLTESPDVPPGVLVFVNGIDANGNPIREQLPVPPGVWTAPGSIIVTGVDVVRPGGSADTIMVGGADIDGIDVDPALQQIEAAGAEFGAALADAIADHDWPDDD